MEIKKALYSGLKKGLKTTWQLAKLIVPIYFAMTFLKHTPVLAAMAGFFQPVLGLMGLPGEAALAIVMGIFINIYAAIAVILPLIAAATLDARQLTVLATVILICHNIPVESAVNQKTGVPFWQMTVLRAGSAIVTGIILNWVI